MMPVDVEAELPGAPSLSVSIIAGRLVLKLAPEGSRELVETVKLALSHAADLGSTVKAVYHVVPDQAGAANEVLAFCPLPPDRSLESLRVTVRPGSDDDTSAGVTAADETTLAAIRDGRLRRMGSVDDEIDRDLQLVRRALAARFLHRGYAVDVATIFGPNYHIDGWIENGSILKIFMLSDDASVLIRPEDIFFKPRADITELIERRGDAALTAKHGFSAASAVILPSTTSFRVLADDEHECTLMGEFQLDRPASQQATLDRLLEAFDSKLPPVHFARRYMLSLLGSAPPDGPGYTTKVVHPGEAKTQVSIVVPLYGEPFFIRSLLAMQQFFPEGYEWILVCDDARLAEPVADALLVRRHFITNRTVLVTNAKNYGYSTSNNIGAEVARGKHLLFMNSDVWIRSCKPIDRASQELSRGRWSILGFELLFEDGTLQHGGMAFARDPEYENLYLIDHPGKGLPPDSLLGDVVPAHAVTGAMMMISKKVFSEIGGFSKSYVRGDFEDADLCLRARAKGCSVGVVPTRDIFHLERQSIRTMGSDRMRAMVTYCNCATFNHAWERTLDGVMKSGSSP